MHRRELIAPIALIAGGSLASGFVQAALRGAPLHVRPPKSGLSGRERESCMASSSCVNPSLTFMALTARAANYAAEQLKARAI